MPGKISASLMCADFGNLQGQLQKLERMKIEYIHFDVMDGSFVPNFTMGPDILRWVRKNTEIPLDIHLMTYTPERFISLFDPREGDIVAVHPEVTVHLQRTLQQIRSTGAKAAVALNPATPFRTLEYVLDDIDVILIMTVNPGFAGQSMVPAMYKKIKDVALWVKEQNKNIEIAVDGNVSFEHAPKMREAGADIFVGGTSGLFREDMDIEQAVNKLRKYIE